MRAYKKVYGKIVAGPVTGGRIWVFSDFPQEGMLPMWFLYTRDSAFIAGLNYAYSLADAANIQAAGGIDFISGVLLSGVLLGPTSQKPDNLVSG